MTLERRDQEHLPRATDQDLGDQVALRSPVAIGLAGVGGGRGDDREREGLREQPVIFGPKERDIGRVDEVVGVQDRRVGAVRGVVVGRRHLRDVERGAASEVFLLRLRSTQEAAPRITRRREVERDHPPLALVFDEPTASGARGLGRDLEAHGRRRSRDARQRERAEVAGAEELGACDGRRDPIADVDDAAVVRGVRAALGDGDGLAGDAGEGHGEILWDAEGAAMVVAALIRVRYIMQLTKQGGDRSAVVATVRPATGDVARERAGAVSNGAGHGGIPPITGATSQVAVRRVMSELAS